MTQEAPEPVGTATPLEPIVLTANQPRARFYEGGEQIARFRSLARFEARTPEDWIGSTTSVRASSPSGLTVLPDGRALINAIRDAPREWLGPTHVAQFGIDTMLLVKLLDAGQRLPIHAHPDGQFAGSHLATAHGKAEAWYTLEPGTVYLGLTEDVDFAELLELVLRQDTARLLSLMHAIELARHDTVFVPHGLLHSIDTGMLLAEVQEPEDLSILLEWKDFELDGLADGHLGVGFELALTAVEIRGRSREEIGSLVRHSASDGPVLAEGSDRYFRLDRITADADIAPGFSIIIALEGSMTLATAHGTMMALPAGSTTLVPYAAGAARFTGPGTVLVARPPLPG